MQLGVCYYPEQWNENQWREDAISMVKLGLRVVRIGQFVWTKLEPRPGQYEWEWLDRFITIFAENGLQIVLSTPTSVPPAWLVHQFPEIKGEDYCGHQPKLGTQHTFCPSNILLKEHIARLISEMGKRYGQNTAVIGWQIDHAIGSQSSYFCYCPQCQKEFQDWLKNRYQTIENLNDAWGTVVQNQTYTDWDEINFSVTGDLANPSHHLETFRFFSDTWAKFIKTQVGLLKRYIRDQFVTHNFSYNGQNLDLYALAQPLDFSAWNAYPTGYAEMAASDLYPHWEINPDLAYEVGDPYITGFYHAMTRGLCDFPFWVMEQQTGQTNWGRINPGIRPGTIRLWTWHAVANGAEAVLYQRWRAARFGAQQYQSAFLRHDGSYDLGFSELSSMGPEGPVLQQLKDAPVSSDVAILVNFEDLWAFDQQPIHHEINYRQIVFNYYCAFTKLGVSVDLIPYNKELTDYRLIVAPVFYLTNQDMVNKIEAYIARGGAIVFGFRSGSKSEINQITEKGFPGELRSLVGGWIKDWQSLPDDVHFPFRSDIHGLRGEAGHWIEAIKPDEDEGVKVLARYLGGPLAGQAAITEHAFGAGFVYYLGFYPLNEQLKQIIRYLMNEVCNENVLDLPDGVVVYQRGTHRIAFNFTRNEKTIVLDDKMTTIPPRDFRFFLRDWS